MCTGLLPPGANPIAVKILIIIITDAEGYGHVANICRARACVCVCVCVCFFRTYSVRAESCCTAGLEYGSIVTSNVQRSVLPQSTVVL